MIKVNLNNPTIILTPLSEEEAENKFDFASLYVLYVNYFNDVEIGIPDMKEYSYFLANMQGLKDATKKAYFYSGGNSLKMKASEITDRPVYEVLPSDDRKVVACNIINNVNIGLTDVLNGKFQPENKENKKTKLKRN